MTYQVLARKWRPRNFATMAGQEHVVRALTNALTQQRLHHAYLLTGTRGVGKTTVGRILAKCLNCEQGISATPCEQCTTCLEINAGRFIDLIEVDAASRTKVEDTRELLDNVQYVPHKGRYKIYLIDEVHMLSGHSFNALLKTLEEPPPHVKFILATTDPQKLPPTVLSRCLQFHLKNLPAETISTYLQKILNAENIGFELPALQAIARAAQGSMRDSLSLLDQAIAYGNGQVHVAEVNAMLGSIDQSYLIELLQALAHQQIDHILRVINNLSEQGADFNQVLEDLLLQLHRLALHQALPTFKTSDSDFETLQTLASRFTSEEIQLYYQIALTGRRDLPLAPSSQIGFEMLLLRMLAFKPISAHFVGHEIASETAAASSSPTTAPAASKSPPPSSANPQWATLITQLNLTGPTKALAEHCVLAELTDQQAQLILEPSQSPLLNDRQKQRLSMAFSNHFQRPMQVNIEIRQTHAPTGTTPAALMQQQTQEKQQTAAAALQKDQNIQGLIATFNATIVPDSIRPIETLIEGKDK